MLAIEVTRVLTFLYRIWNEEVGVITYWGKSKISNNNSSNININDFENLFVAKPQKIYKKII